jgi:acetyl-CoA carboxylase biotin carboxyl carrier protein
MEADVMKALLEAFEHSDWQEMTVTIGGDRLHISRLASSNGAALDAASALPEQPSEPSEPSEPSAPAAPAAPPPAATAAADEGPPVAPAGAQAALANGTHITSPSVGLFWRAPAPGTPPFVEVGGSVMAGETVAIVEVMKLMNHVTATVSGTVTAVLAENGAAVEYGDVLVVIEPDA